MTDLEDMQTDELLNEFDRYIHQPGTAAIIAELKLRVIKENDSDDKEYQSVYAWRGGVRPKRAPRV